MSGYRSGGHGEVLRPGLEHQYGPQFGGVITMANEMLGTCLPDGQEQYLLNRLSIFLRRQGRGAKWPVPFA